MPSFSVSSNGSSVQTSTGPDKLLDMNYPMSKLDVTNIVSFQTISILFNHEPPQASPLGSTDTLLYQFKHGYNYVPAFWMIWQNPAPAYPSPPPSGGTATKFPVFGDETASINIFTTSTQASLLADVIYNDAGFGTYGNYSTAFLWAVADETNISIYVRKQSLLLTSGGTSIPVFLIGITVNIRIDCFVEPANTSDY